MDKRPRYEQLIAGKLESLPVPDMQDQIWARIKAQLDIDLPTDEGDGGSGPQQPSGPGILGWGLSIVLIALVTAFFLSQNKPQTENTAAPSTPNTQSLPPSAQEERPPDPTIEPGEKTKPVKPEPASAAPTNGRDSSFMEPMNPDIAASISPDSASMKANEPAVALTQPQADSTLPAKKSRGVKGLSNNDYRIVPKNE